MSKIQHFGWFLSRGFGPQGWGKDSYDWGYDWTKPRLYQESARYLEQAGFDLIVIEDALSLGTETTTDLRVRSAYGGPKHDPIALTHYLLAATEHIGIVPTLNPLSMNPYTGARLFSTLQHLSGGRVGINLVTDVGSSRHFGQETLPHDEAYKRAGEWLEAARTLWHSWPEGTLVQDAASGVFADASRLKPVRYEGDYYTVEGPLNAAPFPEDPLIVSPGGSPIGLAFAARHAQVKLAMTGLDPANVLRHRTKIRDASVAAEKDPDGLRTLFVLKPIVVPSDADADALVEQSHTPSDDALAEVVLGLSSDLDTDLTGIPLDAHVDPAIFGDHVSRGTIDVLLGGYSSFEDATLRELVSQRARLGRIGDGTGFVTTPTELVDFIERIGEEADNDGILFHGDLHPSTLHRVLDDVVPELRRRGILRRTYPEGGLRANLRDSSPGGTLPL